MDDTPSTFELKESVECTKDEWCEHPCCIDIDFNWIEDGIGISHLIDMMTHGELDCLRKSGKGETDWELRWTADNSLVATVSARVYKRIYNTAMERRHT